MGNLCQSLLSLRHDQKAFDPILNNISKPVVSSSHDAAELKLVLLLVIEPLERTASESYSLTMCFKSYFQSSWIYITVLFGLIGLIGTAGNLYMIGVMKRESSFRRLIDFLLTNLCLSDILKCIVVLPLSLQQELLQWWWLGPHLCDAMPMLQTGTSVLSVLTYLLIGIDRYLVAHKLYRKEDNPFLYVTMLVGLWSFSLCLVLPFRSSVSYISLEKYFGPRANRAGLCVISQGSLMREYNFASFVALFAIPMVLVAYFFIRASEELKDKLAKNETSIHQLTNEKEDDHVAAAAALMPKRVECEPKRQRTMSFINCISQEKAQLNLMLKANRSLAAMVMLFVLCWAPLQIMLLAGQLLREDHRTVVITDLCFLVFMMLGLASTIVNPIILLLQRRAIQQTLDMGRQMWRRLSSTKAAAKRKEHTELPGDVANQSENSSVKLSG